MSKNINIEIPDEVHKSLKMMSVEKEKSLKELITEIISK